MRALYCYDDRTGQKWMRANPVEAARRIANGEHLPNLWSEWYRKQAPEVRGKHDQVWENLETIGRWEMPHVRKMKGLKDMHEVRITGKVQWRLFGLLTDLEFTVVAIGTHKDDDYKPRDILKTAEKRIAAVIMNPNMRVLCDRPR